MSAENTVIELKARVDILETMYAYCRHADNLDPLSMVALFTDDCIANFVPGAEEYTLRGKAQLTRMLTDALAVTVSGSHHISNAELIFESADRAVLHCYMYSWQRFSGFPVTADCHRWGRYENRFVGTAEGWRMDRLKLVSAGEYGARASANNLADRFRRPSISGAHSTHDDGVIPKKGDAK